MRTQLFAVLATLAVAGCGRAGSQPQSTTTYQHVVDVTKGEAERIAATPGLVVRRGRNLDVLHNGNKIYTTPGTDCARSEDCRRFYFIRPVKLRSPVTHQIETYAELLAYDGPDGYFIPLENGRTIHIKGEAAGSPDGRWLAFGSQSFDNSGSPSVPLTFRNMTKRQPDIVFNTPCTPNEWLDSERLTVLCQYDANDKPDLYRQTDYIWFEGVAQQDNAGRWTVRHTRIITRRVTGF